MAKMGSILVKIVVAVLVPIIGIPLYDVGYQAMNDSFGGNDQSWAVDLYTIAFVLVFALIPLGLLFFIFQDIKGM